MGPGAQVDRALLSRREARLHAGVPPLHAGAREEPLERGPVEDPAHGDPGRRGARRAALQPVHLLRASVDREPLPRDEPLVLRPEHGQHADRAARGEAAELVVHVGVHRVRRRREEVGPVAERRREQDDRDLAAEIDLREVVPAVLGRRHAVADEDERGRHVDVARPQVGPEHELLERDERLVRAPGTGHDERGPRRVDGRAAQRHLLEPAAVRSRRLESGSLQLGRHVTLGELVAASPREPALEPVVREEADVSRQRRGSDRGDARCAEAREGAGGVVRRNGPDGGGDGEDCDDRATLGHGEPPRRGDAGSIPRTRPLIRERSGRSPEPAEARAGRPRSGTAGRDEQVRLVRLHSASNSLTPRRRRWRAARSGMSSSTRGSMWHVTDPERASPIGRDQ